MRIKHILMAVLLTLGMILPIGAIVAQDPPPDTDTLSEPSAPETAGNLDRSFAGFGFNAKVSDAPLDIYALALQSDGKLVVAGIRHDTFGLARYNADGTLDASFGAGGVVEIKVYSGQSAAGAYAVTIQPNGRIVAAGFVVIAGQKDFALVRLLPDGSADNSFSDNGRAYSDFDDGDDVATGVAVRSDGRIIVAGTAAVGGDDDFAVERFNSDGTLDTGFSDNGKVNIGFGSDDFVHALVLQSDGKIVIAGGYCDEPLVGDCAFSPDFDFALARLTIGGVLDPTFDTDGKVTTGFGGDEIIRAIALQSDGKIIVAGWKQGEAFALARYLSNGSLDASFDGDGKLTTAMGGSFPAAFGLLIQPDGKIVAAGVGDDQFALLRYTSSGILDNSFGGDGKVITNFLNDEHEVAHALALQPDGRLVAAGLDDDLNVDRGLLARYFPDGSLDTGGRQLIAFGAPVAAEKAYALAVQPDGKIVAAGYKSESTDQFALARLKPDGALDPTFDGDGLLTFGFGGEEQAQAVAIGGDGAIVAAGFVTSPNAGENYMLARFDSDGAFDCFNITDFNDGDDWPYAVAIQPDQKIVVAGRVWDVSSNNYEMGVARYNADCSIDSSFGTGGKTQAGFGAGAEFARAVIVQPDGRIVMAGAANNNLVLVRLTENGVLDVSFGSGGRVVKDLGGDEVAYALARLDNGQLIVAGTTGVDFLFARYNPNGSLDAAFGTNGVSTLDFGGAVDIAYGVAVDANGTITAAGCGLSVLGPPIQFEVAQLRADGAPDTAFSGDGKVVTTFGDVIKCAHGVGFTSNNGIVVGGFAEANNDVNFALAQYLTTVSEGGSYRVYLSVVLK